MRRVVVTGMGIWSCIGQSLDEVTESLRQGKSGIISDPSRLEYGLKSAFVGNVPKPDLKPLLARKFRVNLSDDAEYAYMAAREAFHTAGISDEFLLENEVGMVFGNDGNFRSLINAADIMRETHNSLMLGPSALFKSLSSSVTMNLSTVFHLKGISLSVAAACASGCHAIGVGSMLIRDGLQDMLLVGGSVEMDKQGAAYADALDSLTQRVCEPEKACRPFDRDRDGMVQSGGAAALVLEEYEHAVARGATIFAEIAGYGFSTNGTEDISQPDVNSEQAAMQRALDNAGVSADDVDYVNAHATSTVMGDRAEAIALTRLFKGKKAWISSTKSMTGHEYWMAGASEVIYSILMMRNGFVAPNINLENVDESAADLRIARVMVETPVNVALSNSSGMGGTNAAIVLSKIGH